MFKLTASILTAVIPAVGMGMVEAADSDHEVNPPVDERFQALAQGTLIQIGKEYVWVTEKDGKETRLYVEKSTTKSDKGRGANTVKSKKTTRDLPQRKP